MRMRKAVTVAARLTPLRTLCRITNKRLYRYSHMGSIRLGAQRLKVLAALLGSNGGELSGADIMRQTDLASGTVYPILYAFQAGGLVESRWETEAPEVLQRPQRRLYRLTGLGEATHREWMHEHELLLSQLRSAESQ
jgi:PadR family transcriptional regulator PadR